MARMSIYVGDELKAKMDELGDRVNWSNEAQSAFRQAVVTHTFPMEPTMNDVVARLRASKAEFEKNATEEGLKEGRDWAMHHAEYSQLKSLGDFDADRDDLHSALPHYLDIEEPDDLWGEGRKSDEYMIAFINGALQVWHEVSSQL